jgi:hypothetical protein
MKFDSNFREILSENLQLNKPLLREESLKILSESIDTSYRIILDRFFSSYSLLKLDMNYVSILFWMQ